MSLDLLRWAADFGLRVADQAGVLDRVHTERSPIVLMYHSILWRTPSAIGLQAVDRAGFARQMQYLKRHFHIIHPNDLKQALQSRFSNAKQAVVLTFDDGLATNATVAAPILRELQIPALFFVSTRHLQSGRYLWFMHAKALFGLWPAQEVNLLGRKWKLCSPRGRNQCYRDFLEESRKVSIDEVYEALSQFAVEDFVPPEIIDEELRGITEAELATMGQDNLVVIGSHTCNHPYLTKCTTMQLEEEINGAKAKLEQICSRAVTTFAYPSGDYNGRVTAKVKQAGFDLAFAVTPRHDATAARMAIPRVGVYRNGLGILAAKGHGLTGR